MEEAGSDYSDDELDLEDTSQPDYREWLLTTYNGIWSTQTFKTMLNFDLFTEKVQQSYTSEVLKEVSGFIASIGECPELNEEMKW